MIKKIAALFLLVILTALLGGCWSRVELSEAAMVLGAGVDWTADKRIRLTLQIARPSAFATGGEAGGGKEATSWVVSAEGNTIEEALRYLTMQVTRDIHWPHCFVLVIGEDMAKQGTSLVTNFFQRERQTREIMRVMVAQGEAKDFLETSSILEKTSAQAVSFLLRMRTGHSVQLREFAEMLASKGIQPVATRVEVKEVGVTPGQDKTSQPQKQVIISGLGVFKEDKLIGWLDANETRGLLWLKGEPMKGEITVPSPEEPAKKISIRIRQKKTKVVPEYDRESLRFDVEVKVEGDIVEQQSRENLAAPEKIKALEKGMAKEIEKRITVALEKAQDEYGVDIFGFGEAFHRKYKKDWRELQDRWDEEFAQAKVNINVEAHVREMGLLTKRASTPEE